MKPMSQTLPRTEADSATGVSSTTRAASSFGPDEGAALAQPLLLRSVPPPQGPPIIEVALPVYNEELVLEASTRRLRSYLDQSFPFQTTIRIVDNASTDQTWAVATRLADTVPGVEALHLDQKGKGRAVRAAWSTSSAQVVCYMDVDLSTDLGALLPLVAPLLSGHSDVSIGSRFAPGAQVLRHPRREVVSTFYNIFLRGALRPRFTDSTCGFKAARRGAAALLLPLVDDNNWFFDTEFLVLAERNGFRIHEVPVDWVDDADSRVHVAGVAWEDFRGVARLMRNRAIGNEPVATDGTGRHLRSSQTTRYASVGIASTLLYLAEFLLLRNQLGVYAANVIALAVSTVANTIGHACFTFGTKSGVKPRDAAMAGGLGFVTAVALTTMVLALENAFGVFTTPSEMVAILIGIVGSAFVRLTLLRSSAYRSHTLAARSSTADHALEADPSPTTATT